MAMKKSPIEMQRRSALTEEKEQFGDICMDKHRQLILSAVADLKEYVFRMNVL